jgi:hypothetical protein
LVGDGQVAEKAQLVSEPDGTDIDASEECNSPATSNCRHFDANPLRIWLVTDSRAVVEGEDLGHVGELTEQAHLADVYFPQPESS